MKTRSPCQKCGGPKPAGIGRRLCDACLELSKEVQRLSSAEYSKVWYQANRDRILALQATRRDADPDGYRRRKVEEARRWQLANSEKARENKRRYWAKKKYNLTLEELEAILVRGCAICGVKEDPQRGNRRHGRLCVDHDHTNGRIRDALCHGCNTGLGSFADDPTRLRAAADYLETHCQIPS